MSREPRAAAEEILARIARLRRFQGQDISAFGARSDERAIIERDLEVLSEASRSLPDTLKAGYPDLDWRGIADIGNVLRHGYDRLLPERLESVINERLDGLEVIIAAFISEQGQS